MPLDLSRSEIIYKECPLEGNCDWVPLYESSFGDFHLPIQVCKTCGLQAQFPRPEPESLYTEEYYTGKEGFTYRDERETEKFDRYVWFARLKNISKFKSSGNFLDIGCSFGGFLQCAKEKGFVPFGVEISPYSAKIAKERGFTVWEGQFLDADLPENFFDVITLIEVIEHLENPKLVFDKLSRILRPGGLLLIQTANFEGWQAIEAGSKYHYYLPGHVYYYSEKNLRKILANRSFRRQITYLGVDFPLSAKLLKSRGSFVSWKDYWKWFRIALYHWKSKFSKQGRPLTSSMVHYAIKK
ncbi:class I SAM-dependent methyltransferase [Leptospira langatensis]|uniref:Class I SAM-dependent methyltransferase n=1 Tax=Leptospira langatensis TaxID=2484983 RepID=A0A5F1ZZ26_9LEPT|nr:class I SAM-dependent methyltransferase [Leptospira langatensis]TGL43239.1 class I SAM-dependent methyltransferase [Leptospira langatensis]